MASIKNCNFSCTCNRDTCDRKHYIEDKSNRIIIKELFDKYYERSSHNETDPDGVRNTPCFFGPICTKPDCNFKHYCKFEFRKEIMSKEWYKISRKGNKEKILAELKEKYKITDDDMEKLSRI
jgi:hypothetical protein